MYIGLDVHKRSRYYSMIDDVGGEVKKGKFPTTREGLEEFSGDLMRIHVSGVILGRFGFGPLRSKRANEKLFVAIVLVATIAVALPAFVLSVSSQLSMGGYSSIEHQQTSGQDQHCRAFLHAPVG